jgi:hypothetical protein
MPPSLYVKKGPGFRCRISKNGTLLSEVILCFLAYTLDKRDPSSLETGRYGRSGGLATPRPLPKRAVGFK